MTIKEKARHLKMLPIGARCRYAINDGIEGEGEARVVGYIQDRAAAAEEGDPLRYVFYKLITSDGRRITACGFEVKKLRHARKR